MENLNYFSLLSFSFVRRERGGKGRDSRGFIEKIHFNLKQICPPFSFLFLSPPKIKVVNVKKNVHPVNIFYCGLQFSELTCNWAVTSMVSTKTGELIVLPQADPGLLFVCLVSRIKTKGRRHFMKGENNESCEFLLWCLHDLSQSVLPSQSMLPCLSF